MTRSQLVFQLGRSPTRQVGWYRRALAMWDASCPITSTDGMTLNVQRAQNTAQGQQLLFLQDIPGFPATHQHPQVEASMRPPALQDSIDKQLMDIARQAAPATQSKASGPPPPVGDLSGPLPAPPVLHVPTPRPGKQAPDEQSYSSYESAEEEDEMSRSYSSSSASPPPPNPLPGPQHASRTKGPSADDVVGNAHTRRRSVIASTPHNF